MSQVLEFDIHERIATLTLNRPDQHNAFNDEMIALWTRALEECLVNDDVRCVVVTGAGKTFCSGGDLQELRGDIGNAASTQKAKLWEGIHGVAKALHRLDKPVIAAVNGAATGAGMDMALWCDLRFAADSARFAETYVKVGLVPGDGGAWLLPRLIGTSRALELLLTGDFISAERALELGLVNRVYPAAELLEQAAKDDPAAILNEFTDASIMCLERLRDTPLFAQPYFEFVAILPAIEDGWKAFEAAEVDHA